ncbi:MAG: hypothetical protein JKY37_14910 [Nannocystaceae bacterium]|nr:hypothetical protein [Nannocystaceae bacterium]
MNHTAGDILATLDACCESFSFPMLDNGYLYLAASRLAAYRSQRDWALTVEVAGFSPRSEVPDTHIYTFGSTLTGRKTAANFVTPEAFENYLVNNPNNESKFIFPFDDAWIDQEAGEFVAEGETQIELRGTALPVPTREEYEAAGVILDELPRIAVYQLVRAVAETKRRDILANLHERRHHVPADLEELIVLDDWHHPDVVGEERPSGSETFRQLATALVTGDRSCYSPTKAPNTHWRHWPDGGSL